MKIFRYWIFLSILCGIFFVIYQKCEEKGFRRWRTSFKTAIIFSAIATGSGAVFFILPVGVVSLTGAFLAGAIAFNVVQGITECDKLVSKVIMERSSEGKAIGWKTARKESKSFY